MNQLTVIKTGGKQYIVKAGQKLKIEKVAAPMVGEPRLPRFAGEAGHRRDAKEGDNFDFVEVLLVVDEKGIKLGDPFVSGAKVSAKILRQARDRKKIIFRY